MCTIECHREFHDSLQTLAKGFPLLHESYLCVHVDATLVLLANISNVVNDLNLKISKVEPDLFRFGSDSRHIMTMAGIHCSIWNP